MIDISTLFILGAGASWPYGFPIGTELKKQVINNFSTDIERLVANSSLQHREKLKITSEAKDFVDHFSKAPVESIDKYLANNPMYSDVGKMAITLYILQKERTSKFFDDEKPPDDKEDWYRLIFNRMISNCNKLGDYKKFRENKIAFITFNYDRSLEYFLSRSFCYNFWESRYDFEFSLRECIPFPIIHVYGQVRPFEWSSEPFIKDIEDDYRETIESYKRIAKLSEGIRIVSEKSDNVEININDLITSYERIFFCGFGYAKENLDALSIPKCIDERFQIFGTAKGMSEKEIQDINKIFPITKYQTMQQPGDQIICTIDYAIIENKNSYELLREHL